MRAALSFLTILPVGRVPAAVDRVTLLAFPFVGAVVGLAWWLTATVGLWAWQPFVAATLVLAVDLLVTGGLHADAVADVADGVASRRDRESVHEVLADPRIGGVGAAALITTWFVRVAAIVLLVTVREPVLLLVVPVVGRAGMVVALASMPWTQASLAADFVVHASGWVVWTVTIVVAAVAVVLGTATGGVAHTGLAALVGLAAAVAVGRWWTRRYRSASGDAVGTAGVAAETVTLLALAAG